jgi:ribosomal 50S subunit-recycling heat shock protein
MAEEWELPANVETTNIERLGGGYAWESGVYDAIIKMAYITQAKSGAIGFNVLLENSQGKELKECFYIKSGKAKGNKTYYTKDGKDYPLPGYSVANSLCVAATGMSLPKCMATHETKTINVYDPAAGKEVPAERPVIMAVHNKPIKVAVHQITEDKNKKNDATGKYESTGETRTVNECKFFGNTEGFTADEITNKKEAKFFDTWAAKNTGNVIDKSTKNAAGASAADIMQGGSTDNATSAETTNKLFQ